MRTPAWLRCTAAFLVHWLGPLGHLFSRHPLVLLPLGAFFAIHWGYLLVHFEAFQVIWSDHPVSCGITGVMIAILCGGAMTACWWLDRVRARGTVGPGGGAGTAPAPGPHVAVWVVLCALAALPAVCRADLFRPGELPADDDGNKPDPIPLPPRVLWAGGVHLARYCVPIGLAVAVAIGLGVYAFGRSRVQKTKNAAGTQNWLWWLGWGPPLFVTGGYVVFSLTHWVWPDFYVSFWLTWLGVTAAHTALLLLCLLVFAGMGLHRLGYGRGGHWFYPLVAGVPLAFVLFGGYAEPIHQVPGLEAYYADTQGDKGNRIRPQLDDYMRSGRYREQPGWEGGKPGNPTWPLVGDARALESWERIEQNRRSGEPVVLSVSGGASTSAVYVARSLFRVEAHRPGFVQEIRIICGASGGMLGAAHFVAQFRAGSPYRAEARVEGYKQFHEWFSGRPEWKRYDPEQRDPEKRAPVPATFSASYDLYRRSVERPMDQALAGVAGPPCSWAYQRRTEQLSKPYLAGMDAMERRFMEGMEADFLSPLFEKWVHRDLNPVLRFFPQSTPNDRGAALEAAWNEYLRGRPKPGPRPADQPVWWDWDGPSLDVPFSQLRTEEEQGAVPSLVFTPMIVEDGRQLIISNLDLSYMVGAGSFPATQGVKGQPIDPKGPANVDGTDPNVTLSLSAVEFYRLFPRATETFKLGTAVRLNATFPALSPAAELPTNPPRRVVDAGYYDNYGLVVAARWIEHNRAWFLEPGRNRSVWVIQLWCYGYSALSKQLVTPVEKKLIHDQPFNYRAIPDHGLRSSTLPLGAIYNAWDSSMANRGDERLNGVLHRLNLDRWDERARVEEENQLRTALGQSPLELPYYPAADLDRKDIGDLDVPMNWVLSQKSLAVLDRYSSDFALLANDVRERPEASPEARVKVVLNNRERPVQINQLSPSERASLYQNAALADKLFNPSKKSSK